MDADAFQKQVVDANNAANLDEYENGTTESSDITSRTEYSDLNERQEQPSVEELAVPDDTIDPLKVNEDVRLNRGIGDRAPLAELNVPELEGRAVNPALHPEIDGADIAPEPVTPPRHPLAEE